VNAAVLLDNTRPIGCDARRIDSPKIVLRVRDVVTTVDTWADLADRHDPMAPAALLKCCVARRYPPRREDERLLGPDDAGVELRAWSTSPTGSGLGTSSILAACVVAALDAALTGNTSVDRASLVGDAAVVEQELTTAGGFQDNVGGVYGGVKFSCCAPRLPLEIRVSDVKVGKDLDRYLVLVNTGAARLARNLLDNVVKRWHARLPDVVNAVAALQANAADAADALRRGDVAALGRALDAYWGFKKTIAACADVEPPEVCVLIDALRPHIHGASLCGAGGGGFLLVVARQPDAVPYLTAVLADAGLSSHELHAVAFDTVGLSVVVESVVE